MDKMFYTPILAGRIIATGVHCSLRLLGLFTALNRNAELRIPSLSLARTARGLNAEIEKFGAAARIVMMGPPITKPLLLAAPYTNPTTNL